MGCEFNPDTMRNEMVSFAEVALSPFAVSKFCHTVTSAWVVGGVFCVAVCSWYLLKKRETKMAIESIKIGAVVGLVASVLAAATGHKAAQDVAASQPMKLAAMEALYNGGTDVGLTAVAWVNPFSQPDYENEDGAPLKIETYSTFRNYLDNVFTLCNSTSMWREMKTVSPKELRVGDCFVYVNEQTYGHVVTIVDMAVNAKGEKVFMVAQSWMPAQQIHIVMDERTKSPWYRLTDNGSYNISGYVMGRANMKRFVQ